MRLLGLIIIIEIIIVMGIAGKADAEDEKLELERYCQMVSGNHWPDYRDAYSELCEASEGQP